MLRPRIVLLLLALAAAAPALAQDEQEPDAIGAVLANGQNPPIHIAPTAPPPIQMIPPSPPRAMPTANAPPPPPTAPRLEQTGVSPDGPASTTDIAFESRIRQSVAAAQGLQGALDGQWTLYDGSGRPLYVFIFIDPAGGRGSLEAAWRNPRRVRGADDLGVVDTLQHTGLTLTLNFTPHGGAPATAIQLQGQSTGAWDGQMTEAGTALKVSLRRN
jgi:hypothetical protein